VHRMTKLVATLLSLVTALASTSASACDLSCWLHERHADCRPSTSTAAPMDHTAMSTSSEMDMGSGQTQGTSEHAGASQTGTNGGPLLSRGIASCGDEMCPQISVSTAPPNGRRFQSDPLQPIETAAFKALNRSIILDHSRVESPPPKIIAAVPLVTALRI
jgi:hypothetical protein